MKRCDSCGIFVASPAERCPLCYSALAVKDDAPEIQAYPNLAATAARYNLIFRVLLFLSLTAAGVCATTDFLTGGGFNWSLVVMVNIAYMWAAIGTLIKRRRRLGFVIMVQVVCLALFMVAINYFYGSSHWAFNYIVPFLFISATLSITIIIIVKRVRINEFILYFFMTALLGFLPLVMLWLGQVTVLWPSITSAVYSFFSMLGLFLFADNATKIELKKRFHL